VPLFSTPHKIAKMLLQLYQLYQNLTTPHSLDPNDVRREFMTRIILFYTTAIMYPATVLFLVLGHWKLIPATMPLVGIIAVVVLTAAWGLTYWGYWEYSRYSIILLTFSVALFTTSLYGLDIVSTVFYVAVLLFTAMLFGGEAVWWMTALTIASALDIEFARRQGYVPLVALTRNTSFLGLSLTVVVVVSGISILLHFLTSQYQQALDKAHTATNELRQYQQHLETLVADRTAKLEAEIAEREKREQKIRELSQFQHHLIETANVWIEVLDTRANIILWNRAAEEISGYTSAEVLGHGKIWAWLYPDKAYRREIYANVAVIIEKGEMIKDFETAIRCKNGEQRIISWNSRNLVDDNGVPIGSVVIGQDVTARKQTEIALRESLEDKTVLLQEIHHRVKNNLQIIASLLYLQSRQITSPTVLALLQDSQHRVRSMAMVHELLYQSPHLATIEFAGYARRLTMYLAQMYQRCNEVRFTFDIAPVSMDIDTAIPCGLILNELVSNAFKYAFTDGRRGKISISFHQSEDGKHTLVVADDGVGFPPEIAEMLTTSGLSAISATSLGLQLVHQLATQLGGVVSVIPENGVRFEVIF